MNTAATPILTWAVLAPSEASVLTPWSILTATAGLIAFHIGLYTLVGRERKSPYIINSVFPVFLLCLVIAALSVAAALLPEDLQRYTLFASATLLVFDAYDQFITRLLSSPTHEVRETAQRWIVGELWHCTPLHWMAGERPGYPSLLALSHALTDSLGRHCFAYAIKDKRDRRLTIYYDDGSRREHGDAPRRWLLGVGSASYRVFTVGETKQIFHVAASMFGTEVVATAAKTGEREVQACLF